MKSCALQNHSTGDALTWIYKETGVFYTGTEDSLQEEHLFDKSKSQSQYTLPSLASHRGSRDEGKRSWENNVSFS